MRVLIDCNIIVSAAIAGGVCLRAIAEARDNHTILVSEEILGEYRRVAGYTKFSEVTKTKMHVIIEEVVLRAEFLTIPDVPPETESITDEDDLVYVIAAHVGEADAIMTGNVNHFIAPSYGKALVVTAREFLDMVGG
jgi:putative PIN family toxin of toxin-antitoxin system